jgi:hypothetical protein
MKNKDWTGNSVAFAKTGGMTSHAIENCRPEYDYYATDPKAVRFLLELEKFEGSIWECACGEGHLSKEMIRLGYEVKSTDLVNRGFGTQLDFLTVTEPTSFNIVTNPPYRYAGDFITKSLEIMQTGKKLALFLPIRYLEGQARKEIFKAHPPKIVYISSSRLECVINGDFEKMKGSSVGYAWFVWQKGFKQKPIIEWFN